MITLEYKINVTEEGKKRCEDACSVLMNLSALYDGIDDVKHTNMSDAIGILLNIINDEQGVRAKAA